MFDFLQSFLPSFGTAKNPLSLYNTRSCSKEKFEPLRPGEVSMYHCGPTVYDDVHIGNLRSMVFADLLRRSMEWNGYRVPQVINITDVGHLCGDGDEGEDKMTKALLRLGKPMTLEAMREVGTLYFERFKEDLAALNVEMPEQFPRASDYVTEMLSLIKRLEEKGLAYTISDGVYFDTQAFRGYGALTDTSPTEIHRVGENREKRNPRDFALWKLNSERGFPSPYGMGFPGWHIECSAMSMKLLGETFDIHTGGTDLAPIHHNNEIAQSEGATGKTFARYWMHGAFLNEKGSKMAKSVGNIKTLRELTAGGHDPLAYRYLLLTASYRSPLDFSIESLESARAAYKHLKETVDRLPKGGGVNEKWQQQFTIKLNDDLGVPQALAVMYEMLKSDIPAADKRATALAFDLVLGLKLDEQTVISIPPEVTALMQKREEARTGKDWKKADSLRKEIEEKGFEVLDTEKGPELRPR